VFSVLSKGMNGFWFLASTLLWTSPALSFKKTLRYLQTYGYFPLELFPKLQTWKILPQHVVGCRRRSASLRLVDPLDRFTVKHAL